MSEKESRLDVGKIQKWEYACVCWPRHEEDDVDERMNLAYLHPSGVKRLELAGGLHSEEDVLAQLYAWITILGQEGYEMTGVTANEGRGRYVGDTVYTYWFKRPTA